jgi:shikimate dehydrogenase
MKITAATKVVGVVGDPVRHSLSPVMHNGWIADHGLDAVYVALSLKSEDAEGALRALKQFGFAGLNVTVPHKEAAARAAGWTEGDAANVLRWELDGSLSAFNTDGLGFLKALDECAPNWKAETQSVLIVGAGGAARGIAQAISPHVGRIVFANRTRSRAEAAAAAFSLGRGEVLPWENLGQGFAEADLIVQATALGMAGQPEIGWPLNRCKKHALVADIVYRPLETPLLREARAAGLATMDGLGMLIHQGALAFELWFGIRPDTAKARARLLAALT